MARILTTQVGDMYAKRRLEDIMITQMCLLHHPQSASGVVHKRLKYMCNKFKTKRYYFIMNTLYK